MKLRTFAPPILMHLNVKFTLANFDTKAKQMI